MSMTPGTTGAVDPVRIGFLGAGFVCTFYAEALRHVRHHEIVAVHARTPERAAVCAKCWEIPHVAATMADLVARPDVDLVVIGLPHHLHVEAVEAVARAGKAVVCTKPLGRSAEEARRCLKAVTAAGVWHGYAESEVFAPAVVRARSPVEAFCWADRIARDDVQAEDSAILLVRFDDGSLTQVEVGWGHKAGLDVRVEVHATDGYIRTDETGETGLRAFTTGAAGHVIEKATVDRGWVTPLPDEAAAYGYHGEMDHFVQCFRRGETPRQTFRDGVIDNAVIDAGYRSAQSRRWEGVTWQSPI